jgi:hypothetical protein
MNVKKRCHCKKKVLKRNSFINNKNYMNKLKISSIILLMLFFTCSCSSIKIGRDSNGPYGSRIISTKSTGIKVGDAKYNFYLALFTPYETKKYSLGVSSLYHIKENNLLLLKLGNGETIRLSANTVNAGEVDWPKYTPIIGGASTYGISTTQKVDYYSSLFDIDIAILDKIEFYGINKIRIEFFNTFHEQSWKSNKLGKYITKSRNKLDEQLNKPYKSQMSIEEGF